MEEKIVARKLPQEVIKEKRRQAQRLREVISVENQLASGATAGRGGVTL